MFRHKDQMLKAKRQYKKKNVNKEVNKYNKELKGEGGHMFYGESKAIQQHLVDVYGIKVHKNVLRHSDFVNYDEQQNEKVGNTTYGDLRNTLNDIDHSQIPLDWGHKHDKTKWSNAKEKTKRKNDRNKDTWKNPMF